MKKYLNAVLITLFVLSFVHSSAQPIDKEAIYDTLTTIDPEIMQYFPRWKVCESDLQIQIYQAFLLLGYPKENLDMQSVQILAAPREDEYLPYQILMLTCGRESMKSVDIEANITPMLVGILTGEFYYSGPNRGYTKDVPKRDYCYDDIPVNIPMTKDQTAEIVSYLQPTNVNHAISLSLFEQALKIGETGFWLNAKLGTDEIGYHFWSSGEGKIVLRRPLYINSDINTSRGIPFLINAYLGIGYRLTGGLSDESSLLSWVKSRTLNAGKGGKLIGGLDFYFPLHPPAGIHINAEIPMSGLETIDVDSTAWGYYIPPYIDFLQLSPGVDPDDLFSPFAVAPVLRATGQVSLFYHWWLDKTHPENYFRFDLGMGYWEVRELAAFRDTVRNVTVLASEARPLLTYKSGRTKEIEGRWKDWLYFKVEYRNQAAFPFGASIQISNQTLLSRIYMPLAGQWLYVEAKYSTPLRTPFPYEIKHFFMVSPVLRLTI